MVIMNDTVPGLDSNVVKFELALARSLGYSRRELLGFTALQCCSKEPQVKLRSRHSCGGKNPPETTTIDNGQQDRLPRQELRREIGRASLELCSSRLTSVCRQPRSDSVAAAHFGRTRPQPRNASPWGVIQFSLVRRLRED
jgi:hypothetical protein